MPAQVHSGWPQLGYHVAVFQSLLIKPRIHKQNVQRQHCRRAEEDEWIRKLQEEVKSFQSGALLSPYAPNHIPTRKLGQKLARPIALIN